MYFEDLIKIVHKRSGEVRFFDKKSKAMEFIKSDKGIGFRLQVSDLTNHF